MRRMDMHAISTILGAHTSVVLTPSSLVRLDNESFIRIDDELPKPRRRQTQLPVLLRVFAMYQFFTEQSLLHSPPSFAASTEPKPKYYD